MSTDTPVLYDLPGPAARRRALVLSVVAVVVLAAVAVLVLMRLADQGQFSAEKWGALVDPSTEEFRLVWQNLFRGLWHTLLAAAVAIVLSLAIGTAMVTLRLLSGRAGRVPLVGLMELLRGLPVVILIYMSYRILPDVGVDANRWIGPDGLWYLVIGLTLYNSVIFAEILRTGVASLPRGQREAAVALGLSNLQTLRMILLPQAFRTMLPAIISQLVVVLKDTSLAGLLAIYTELLKEGQQISNFLRNPLQTLFVVGLIFIVINFALSRLAVLVEGRLARGKRGTVVDADALGTGPAV
jgi:glutamate transport system permease protein